MRVRRGCQLFGKNSDNYDLKYKKMNSTMYLEVLLWCTDPVRISPYRKVLRHLAQPYKVKAPPKKKGGTKLCAAEGTRSQIICSLLHKFSRPRLADKPFSQARRLVYQLRLSRPNPC